MKPFLKQVAEVYINRERDNLLDYCFVFPNKRSSTFFMHHMKELAAKSDRPVLLPQSTTIERLAARMVPELTEAGRYDQLFTLYNEYKRLSPAALDFDRFRFWGDMLLNDFNEVDRYLVDPTKLFSNLRQLREIGSTFLSEEQRELIRTYWNEEKPEYMLDRFWVHTTGKTDESEEEDREGFNRKFIKLWEILSPLYDAFTQALRRRGLATSGQIMRLAAGKIKSGDFDRKIASRYIFVGFNVLTTAEIKIFDRLKALDMADFYWDFNSPALRDPSNKAIRLVKHNVVNYKSLYPLDEPKINSYASIDIVGIPSKSGQAKYAGSVLEKLADEGKIKPTTENALNTAVVLPDESLLVPLIHAIPEKISKVNVTMGFPMKQTPPVSLLRKIISLHLRARKTDDGMLYFHEDVMAIASHPLLRNVSDEECRLLSEEITQRRLFMVTASQLKKLAPSLKPVFKEVSDPNNFKEVVSYLRSVIDFVAENLTGAESGNKRAMLVIEAYRQSLDTLCDAVERFGITMKESTVFQLIESAVSSESIRFVGKPLEGLQIMGMLETRSLDFDNLIILSMNERIYPRRNFTPSFIPEALRSAFGIATHEFREAASAYNFFRLLSRAKNVTLLYDSRTVGARSSEKSRYLIQLLYLFNSDAGKNIRHTSANYKGCSFEMPQISVAKDERVMKLLAEFTDPESKKRLSPSAINTYINCPLEFYLSTVEGLRQADEINDYMDWSTYGTIVHSVAEKLYTSLRHDPANAREKVEITDKIIEHFQKDDKMLLRLVTRSVNEHYNMMVKEATRSAGVKRVSELTDEQKAALDRRLDTPLSGDAYAMGEIILMLVKEMLTLEKKFTPFTFMAAELQYNTRLRINDNLEVNYRQVIDRIDHIDKTDGHLRIVDYKTGRDETSFRSVESLFEPGEDRPKGILQLLLYCDVYSREENYDGPIQPIIYKFRDIAKGSITGLSIKGDGKSKKSEPVTDYRPFKEEFGKLMRECIESIFDPTVPFTQATYDKACTFCNFKSLCGRD